MERIEEDPLSKPEKSKLSRRRFVLVGLVAPPVIVAYGLTVNAVRNEMREEDALIKGLQKTIDNLNSQLRNNPDSIEDQNLGAELLYNGYLNEASPQINLPLNKALPDGWAVYPDDKFVGFEKGSGYHGGNCITVILDSRQRTPSTEIPVWQDQVPTQIDPDKNYQISFYSILFREEYVALDPSPILGISFIDDKYNFLSAMVCNNLELAPQASFPGEWTRYYANLGKTGNNAKPIQPPEGTSSILIRLSAVQTLDSRFGESRTKFSQISMREVVGRQFKANPSQVI